MLANIIAALLVLATSLVAKERNFVVATNTIPDTVPDAYLYDKFDGTKARRIDTKDFAAALWALPESVFERISTMTYPYAGVDPYADWSEPSNRLDRTSNPASTWGSFYLLTNRTVTSSRVTPKQIVKGASEDVRAMFDDSNVYGGTAPRYNVYITSSILSERIRNLSYGNVEMPSFGWVRSPDEPYEHSFPFNNDETWRYCWPTWEGVRGDAIYKATNQYDVAPYPRGQDHFSQRYLNDVFQSMFLDSNVYLQPQRSLKEYDRLVPTNVIADTEMYPNVTNVLFAITNETYRWDANQFANLQQTLSYFDTTLTRDESPAMTMMFAENTGIYDIPSAAFKVKIDGINENRSCLVTITRDESYVASNCLHNSSNVLVGCSTSGNMFFRSITTDAADITFRVSNIIRVFDLMTLMRIIMSNPDTIPGVGELYYSIGGNHIPCSHDPYHEPWDPLARDTWLGLYLFDTNCSLYAHQDVYWPDYTTRGGPVSYGFLYIDELDELFADVECRRQSRTYYTDKAAGFVSQYPGTNLFGRVKDIKPHLFEGRILTDTYSGDIDATSATMIKFDSPSNCYYKSSVIDTCYNDIDKCRVLTNAVNNENNEMINYGVQKLWDNKDPRMDRFNESIYALKCAIPDGGITNYFDFTEDIEPCNEGAEWYFRRTIGGDGKHSCQIYTIKYDEERQKYCFDELTKIPSNEWSKTVIRLGYCNNTEAWTIYTNITHSTKAIEQKNSVLQRVRWKANQYGHTWD